MKKKKVINPIFSQAPQQQTAPPKGAAARAAASVPETEKRAEIKPNAPRPTIKGLGVSISSIGKEKPKEEVVNNSPTEVLTEKFTPMQLITAWKTFAEGLVEEHHLKNTMLHCLPSLLNRDTFEVVVNNPVQEQRLLDSGTDILTHLRSTLRNTQIQMQIRITVDNEKKLAFTPAEKFRLMMEENDALKRLKDEFGLELS